MTKSQQKQIIMELIANATEPNETRMQIFKRLEKQSPKTMAALGLDWHSFKRFYAILGWTQKNN